MKKTTPVPSQTKYLEIVFLFLVVCISFALKFWLSSNFHFLFWFDQARDSIVSQEMLQTHHLKVQGPSASGTQDTIYHGVIWFYLLAPLYAVAHGNPQGVVWLLAFLTSLAIVPYYFFIKQFSSSMYVAGLACLIIAFSPDSITNSTWIANPVIAYCLFPIFYLSVWKAFFEKKYRWLILATLTLGLLQQSIIFLAYVWIVILASYFYVWQKQKKQFLPLQTLLLAIASYLLAISSMVVTQVKLIANGIYPMLGGVHTELVEKNTFTVVSALLNLYFEKMKWVLLPEFPVFSVAVLLIFLWIAWKHLDEAKRYFLATWMLAPLSLLLFHFRDAIHMILGIEWMLAFCVAFAVVYLCQKFSLKYLFVIFFALLFGGQLHALQTMRQNEESFVGTQQGAWVDQQLHLIDKTYELAQGAPFSISTYTNPYGYNTTWAYLYSWYGKQKYGYEPAFYGPDQTNLFGDQLMQHAPSALPKHFVIIEPITGVPQIIYDDYIFEQDTHAASVSAVLQFGSLKLQQRFAQTLPVRALK